jgi:CO dehydrogenase nickel-insertion accessory protein CooC1
LFVLNKVRNEETETYLRYRLAEHDIEPIRAIHDNPSLTFAWLKGKPLAEVKTKTEVERIVEAIGTAEKICAP